KTSPLFLKPLAWILAAAAIVSTTVALRPKLRPTLDPARLTSSDPAMPLAARSLGWQARPAILQKSEASAHLNALPPLKAVPAKQSACRLGDEIALLELVRESLERADWHLARRLLERYDQDFPQGHLSAEAASFQVEVLLKNGEAERAAEQASRLLAKH